VLGIRVSIPAWQAAGQAMFNWLANRAEIDSRAPRTMPVFAA
jgi:hypothetical protein